MYNIKTMKLRGRPKKQRIIRQDPRISQFSPRGRPGRPNEVELTIDQFEALRLADYMKKNQKEAAKSMNISQQTFSRILRSARQAIAKGLINGNIIKIQGSRHSTNSSDNSQNNLSYKP